MAGRPPYQAQPGQQQPYYPQSSQPPYGGAPSPYPPHSGPQGYGAPQYGAPQQQSWGQPQYGQSSYNRPAPTPPGQNPGYGAPQWQSSPSPQPPYNQGYGYGQQGPPPPGQFQPQQPGYPPQGGAPGGQYGGAPPSQGATGFRNVLQQQIREKGLESFYPPGSPVVEQLANKAAAQIGGLCQRWRIPQEIGNDLAKLGLYDIIIYIDDSGSMQFEENGERIKDLQLILQRVASVSTMFDEDGVQLRFMNANYDVSMLDGIRSEQQIDQLMRNVSFKGLTPMGSALRQKVIDGIVIPKIQQRRYTKPTLVITVTDGQPAGEPQNTVFDTIKYAVDQVSRQFGRGAIAFQFAQVGNDLKAREFLSKLDEDPVVGQMVDCTSNYENESDEMKRQGVDLTPELWLVKLMLGAVDTSYDRKDERPSAGGPPPGQFGGPQGGYQGGPPPGQYGGPQGGYGGPPPQGGYGGPPQGGYTPQGGYGRGGPPPAGYPPQGGQGGAGGYGAPPPPRY